MNCPYCSNPESKVKDKRNSRENIRRRRECLKCGKRFTTYETIDKENLYVIKKDSSREKFSRQKLETGIKRAFEKRPIDINKIEELVNKIEEQIRKKGQKEIQSKKIGEIAMKKIRKIDNVAYIRFASVYRDFQDIKDFKKELKEIK